MLRCRPAKFAHCCFTCIACATLAVATGASALALQVDAATSSAQSKQASSIPVRGPLALILVSDRGFGGQNSTYPPDAQKKHIQGEVVVNVVISKQGDVISANAISGPQILREPAVKAVRTKRYKPHLLNGKHVAVSTTITVVYSLSAFQSGQASSRPLRVSGDIVAGNRIGGDDPQYPLAAKKKHIHGTVEFRVLISKQGTMESLEFISGPAELRDASKKALLTWRYKPYILNGHPVPVSTIIDVTYKRHW